MSYLETYSQWLLQAERELKERYPEALTRTISPDLETPAYPPACMASEPIRVDSAWSRGEIYRIFKDAPLEIIDHSIQSALEEGLERMCWIFTDHMAWPDIATELRPEWLDCQVVTEDGQWPTGTPVSWRTHARCLQYGTQWLSSPASDPIDQIRQIIQAALDYSMSSVISVSMVNNHLLNIALLRALRVALGSGPKSNYSVHARIEASQLPDNPDHALIYASSQILGAMNGGADGVDLIIPSGWPDAQLRAYRHISDVLIMESELSQIPDPSRGSYYIEQLTRQIVDKL